MERATTYASFDIPVTGVTMLGCSHGFDKTGRTTGFVLWVNRRGLMVDPPPNSSRILVNMGIPPSSIEAVFLTHCHADHDAGTFQKILQGSMIKIYTTRTIIDSFLRKYAALSGFSTDFIGRLFEFCPLRVGEVTRLAGGIEIECFYSLHVIPCIGLLARCHDKTIVYSGDTHTSPELFDTMRADGVIGDARCAALKKFPWHADLILHEMGVPPIHTPPDVLRALPTHVKTRLLVVHASKSAIPADSGLERAPEWGTIRFKVIRSVTSQRNEIFTLLRPLLWLAALGDDQLMRLIDESNALIRKIKRGKKLVKAGDPCGKFHVVAVSKKTTEG